MDIEAYLTVLQDGPAQGHTIVSFAAMPERIVMVPIKKSSIGEVEYDTITVRQWVNWTRVAPVTEPWPGQVIYERRSTSTNVAAKERTDSYFVVEGE